MHDESWADHGLHALRSDSPFNFFFAWEGVVKEKNISVWSERGRLAKKKCVGVSRRTVALRSGSVKGKAVEQSRRYCWCRMCNLQVCSTRSTGEGCSVIYCPQFGGPYCQVIIIIILSGEGMQ